MKNDTTGRSTLKSRRLFNNDSSVIVADIVLNVGIHIKGDERGLPQIGAISIAMEGPHLSFHFNSRILGVAQRLLFYTFNIETMVGEMLCASFNHNGCFDRFESCNV